MNFIFNLLFIIVTGGFTVVYLYSLILNIIRSYKATASIKANPAYAEGVISKIITEKNREYVKVDFVSPNNGVKFNEIFQFNAKKVKDFYKEGQNVKIFFKNCKDDAKVTCFPIYLEGETIAMQFAPLLTDFLMLGLGVYLFVYSLMMVLTNVEVGGMSVNGLTWGYARPFLDVTKNFDTYAKGTPTECFSVIYLVLFFVMYFMSFSYIKERLNGMGPDYANQYLKQYGIKGAAEVKTYKFTKSKNAQGVKEAEVKIEFRTNAGELVTATIYSYLYSQSEEQFITILYDPKNPSNVVYMKENAQ